MRVILNSLCTMGALKETRRILDRFAERSTPQTWQTSITQEGLTTLEKTLRKSARRNTAVACFLVSGHHHTLLWVVGARHKFDADGRCPTGSARAPWRVQEDSWRHGRLIRLLADLAGLLHDLGKATTSFQSMLRSSVPTRNQVRHEWVSLRMFEAFVGTDTDIQWLKRLVSPTAPDIQSWTDALTKDYLNKSKTPGPSPFQTMSGAPLAQALGWLVVSHHRLPIRPDRVGQTHIDGSFLEVQADWNETPTDTSVATITPFWSFSSSPVTFSGWQKRASRVARHLLQMQEDQPIQVVGDPFVMHVARLCLMLGDHSYSSLNGTDPRRVKGPFGSLLANTNRETRAPNQTLDEHLLGVALNGSAIAATLPSLRGSLDALCHNKALLQRSGGAYAWQTRAVDAATRIRSEALEHGAFVVNMASTGCGKTLANAKVVNALSDPNKGMRCTFALGLRTLTLQTGQSYQDLLGLTNTQLAVRIGGLGVGDLFNLSATLEDATGSASSGSLELDSSDVHYRGGDAQHPVLQRAQSTPIIGRLVSPPILVCTIDHLVPATESTRGGRQIAPILRLLTADVVLDEPDDFDIEDLPTLIRLAHWTGLFGSRLVLSSATLTPDIVRGLYGAYVAGRAVYMHNMGLVFQGLPCLWCDENQVTTATCVDDASFTRAHQEFVQVRVDYLKRQPSRRSGVIGHLRQLNQLPEYIWHHAQRLHQAHGSVDPKTGKTVSFGLCRMANIGPLVDVARALYQQTLPPNYHLHLCTYHSQYPLALRAHIERKLDAALTRKDPSAVFSASHIRAALDGHEAEHHIFLVLGTPVVEVGRDHDYDWAILELSSMRAAIQGVGRVKRHREGAVTTPNVVLMSQNIRSFTAFSTKLNRRTPAYRHPGFETYTCLLGSHQTASLLRPEEYLAIDATPRLQPRLQLSPQTFLSDLEHSRLHELMLPRKSLNGASWHTLRPEDALLMGTLQRVQRFRAPSREEAEVRFSFGNNQMVFEEYDETNSTRLCQVWLPAKDKLRMTPQAHLTNPHITPWAHVELGVEMQHLAATTKRPKEYCYQRYTHCHLPARSDGNPFWEWHPWLGFSDP